MNTYRWSYQEFRWDDLTSHDKKIFENIELDFLPLKRNVSQLNEYVELSNNTINQIFVNAEQLSKDKKLRTNFGKSIHLPKDSMMQVNKALNSFGRRMQESTPVKAFDQKFEDIKNNVKDVLVRTKGGRNALAYIDVLGNAAKEHPIWQAATIGLLVGVSTFVAGPAGAIVAGPILKGAVELIKGEKLSTAVGKGIYAGALGFLSASIAGGLSHWAEGVRISHITHIGPENLGIEQVSFSGGVIQPINGFNWTKVFRFSNITVDPTLKNEISNAIIRLGGGDYSSYDDLLKLGKKAISPDYIAGLADKVASANAEQITNDAFLNSVKKLGRFIMAAAAGTAVAANDLTDKSTVQPRISPPIVPGSVSQGKTMPTDSSMQIWQWIKNAQQRIDNGTLSREQLQALWQKSSAARDKLKNKPNMTQQHKDLINGFDKIIHSLRPTLEENKLSKAILEGLWSDLTLQFGAGKLKQAWDSSGRPTDSTAIAKMLADMGMNIDDIKEVMIKSGMSENDIDETIKELHDDSDESEFEAPFTSGVSQWDNEAKKILKSKGQDTFILYWEEKIKYLEKEIEDKTPKPEPVQPTEPTQVEEPPKVEPETLPSETIPDDANELMHKLDQEDQINKVNVRKRSALPAKAAPVKTVSAKNPPAKNNKTTAEPRKRKAK